MLLEIEEVGIVASDKKSTGFGEIYIHDDPQVIGREFLINPSVICPRSPLQAHHTNQLASRDLNCADCQLNSSARPIARKNLEWQ